MPAKSKKRKEAVNTKAAPIRKRRRTESIDETVEESPTKTKAKLIKVESNRFLRENLSVPAYQIDPFLQDNLPVPLISSSVQSKLAIRAVNLNDVTLLQHLIDDVEHVSSVHIKRDLPDSLSAIHYAIEWNHLDLLRILLKDLKEPKANRCSLPEVTNVASNLSERNANDENNDPLFQDLDNMIYSENPEEILDYAMEKNCSRQIYDLLAETFDCTGYKNVWKCIQSGHRKLAASIIDDKQQNAFHGFSQLHYQVH